HPPDLTPPADLSEASLLIRTNGCLVEGKDLEQYIVQPQHGEGIVQHQPRGLRTIALVVIILLANHNGKLRTAATGLDVAQVGQADGPAGAALVNSEEDAARIMHVVIVAGFLLFKSHRPGAGGGP